MNCRLLELTGVSVRYGALEAVKDLGLAVAETETVAILGANGAGKSTLLKAIAGVHPIASGSITMAGELLPSGRPACRPAVGIAYVAEGRRIFAGMSVADNLEVASRARKADRKSRMDEIFQLFPRLAERRRSIGWQLSGGEQQMLVIGRALMSKPRLLLLDEPSLGLAPRLIDDLFTRIRMIAAQGTAVLIAEQRVDHALEIADRACVLQLGRIVDEDTAIALAGRENLSSAYFGR